MVAEEDHYRENQSARLAAILRQHPVQQEEAEHQKAAPAEFFAVAFYGSQVGAGQVDDEYEHERAKKHGADGVSGEDESERQHDCVGCGVCGEEEENWYEDEACEESVFSTRDQWKIEGKGGGGAAEEQP